MLGCVQTNQFFLRIYHYAVPISVFITVGGGVYFLYLLLSNRRV